MIEKSFLFGNTIKRGILAVLLSLVVAGAAHAARISDPAATITDMGDTLILTKELNAFPNYGMNDKGSDILYTGEKGSWSFDLTSIDLTKFDTLTVTASLAYDDHYSNPVSNYNVFISFPGQPDIAVTGIDHGFPYGKIFTNWETTAPITATTINNPFVISLYNASSTTANDWVGIDWIKVTLKDTVTTPVPAAVWLLGSGFFGLAGLRRRKFLK